MTDRAAALTSKMRALLQVFAAANRPLTPNQAGGLLPDMPTALSKRGKSMGPGSLIVPTLRALERRGFIARGGRTYTITAEGKRVAASSTEHDDV